MISPQLESRFEPATCMSGVSVDLMPLSEQDVDPCTGRQFSNKPMS
jgi:hypothetical protein